MIKAFIDFIVGAVAMQIKLHEQLGKYQFDLHDRHGYSYAKAYTMMSEAATKTLSKMRKDALRILLWESENLDPRTLTHYA